MAVGKREDLTVYSTRHLPDRTEIDVCEGIPCTTPMRTFVDLAGVVRHPRELNRAVERALALQLFDRNALDAVIGRSNGRRGLRLLRDVLADLADEAPPVTSELERVTLELIVAADLPYPVVNGHIGELQVDFHWPKYKLVVEAGRAATHGYAIAFRRDRDRDLYARKQAGWHVIRLAWRQVVDEPERVIATLRQLLTPR